jgi:hypothetical protein
MNFVFKRPALYSLVPKLGRVAQVFHPLIAGRVFDPAYPWTKTRSAPKIANQTFKEWWKLRKK